MSIAQQLRHFAPFPEVGGLIPHPHICIVADSKNNNNNDNPAKLIDEGNHTLGT